MKKLILLFVSMFFMKSIFAQKNVPGVYNIEKFDTLFIQKTEGSPQMIVFVIDRFCEPIAITVIDSLGFIFTRTDCVYGPCAIFYIYFQNKKMEVQKGEILFYPQKSD